MDTGKSATRASKDVRPKEMIGLKWVELSQHLNVALNFIKESY